MIIIPRELIGIIDRYRKLLVLYEQWVNGEEYYQINTKRDSRYSGLQISGRNFHANQMGTYIFEIGVTKCDKIKIELYYPELQNSATGRGTDRGVYRDSCSGAIKILLLNPGGRVIRSWKIPKSSGGFFAWELSKRNTSYVINATPGRYVLKYWGAVCDDCYHKISVSSMKAVKSIGKCEIKK